MFALLVPSLLTTCYNVVGLNRLVANLSTSCNNADVQGCHSQLIELQDDNKLLEQLVTSLLSSTTVNLVASCHQAVDHLSTSWEQAVQKHPVDNFWNSIATSLPQVCYNFCVFTFVTSLPFTSCRQVVFALLVPTCCNKFGTNC